MEILVSIVIPVYKTEKYIRECINSVLTQDYPHLEIVVVNDGSPDKCAEVCEEYAKDYSNIRVIHQENLGAGIARDSGVKVANGKYVFFLDADDCLEGVETISKLVECAEEKQADITVGSFRKFSEKSISEVNYHHLDEVENTDSVEFRFRGYFQYGHLGFNWGKLYRREFIIKNQIGSLPYPYIEDKAYNMRCSTCKPQYAFLKESVYLYRMKEKEIPFQDKEDFVQVWTKVAVDFNTYLQEKGKMNDYRDLVGIHLFLGVYTLANKVLYDKKNGIIKLSKVLKEYASGDFIQQQFHELAKGIYINELDSFGWRIIIRSTAKVCCLKWYWLLAVGMVLINRLKIDQKVIAKKYSE